MESKLKTDIGYSRVIMFHPDLIPTDRLVLNMIFNCISNENEFKLTNDQLAGCLGVKVSIILSSLGRLDKLGFITRSTLRTKMSKIPTTIRTIKLDYDRLKEHVTE